MLQAVPPRWALQCQLLVHHLVQAVPLGAQSLFLCLSFSGHAPFCLLPRVPA